MNWNGAHFHLDLNHLPVAGIIFRLDSDDGGDAAAKRFVKTHGTRRVFYDDGFNAADSARRLFDAPGRRIGGGEIRHTEIRTGIEQPARNKSDKKPN